MSFRCIYCGREGKPSREHYLPRCLGNFRGYEQLKDRVCETCNNGFSVLDGQFCRSGPEALLRERFNVEGYKHHRRQSPFQKGSTGARPLLLRGSAGGAEVDLYYHRQTKVARRMRQITFTAPGGELTIQVTDDMTEPEHLDAKLRKAGVKRLEGPVLVRADCAPGEWDWILHLLSRFKDVMIGEPELGEISEGVLDDVYADMHPTHLYFRGLAKIGFHYFLKHMPEFHGSEDCFGGVRHFITEGGPEEVDLFTHGRVSQIPIDDLQAKPSPAGYHHHLETQADSRRLLSRLQFFIGPGFRLPVYTIFLGWSPLLIDSTRGCAHSFTYTERDDGYVGEMHEARPYWA